MDQFLTVAVRCRSCSKIQAVTFEQTLEGKFVDEASAKKDWPKLCKGCGMVEVVPLKDGDLDQPTASWDAQVAVEGEVRRVRSAPAVDFGAR